jgi:hypothetical protein
MRHANQATLVHASAFRLARCANFDGTPSSIFDAILAIVSGSAPMVSVQAFAPRPLVKSCIAFSIALISPGWAHDPPLSPLLVVTLQMRNVGPTSLGYAFAS